MSEFRRDLAVNESRRACASRCKSLAAGADSRRVLLPRTDAGSAAAATSRIEVCRLARVILGPWPSAALSAGAGGAPDRWGSEEVRGETDGVTVLARTRVKPTPARALALGCSIQHPASCLTQPL